MPRSTRCSPWRLGLGREAPAPQRDAITVSGDLVVPVDLRHLAFWLERLLGAPVVSGAGIAASVAVQAALQGGTGHSLTVTLVHDVAGS